jgi:transposase
MPKPYSDDLRLRVVAAVGEGASRHEAADRFDVSASSAIRWVGSYEQTGRISAKPSGGSTSPLEAHADFLLALIEKQPDITLDEVVEAMWAAKIAGSRSAVARFYQRRQISFKKKPARQRTDPAGRRWGASVVETHPRSA